MPISSSSGFTSHSSPARLYSPMMQTSVGVVYSGSTVPMTCSSRASPASLLPRFFDPTKPGASTGITGLPSFCVANLQTAAMSSPVMAGTQV